jgi:succinoglycan biosynthesis protein ExoA
VSLLQVGKPEGLSGSAVVVVPCLNEERHIGQVLANLAREAERLDLKVIVADGGSTDRTCSIVQEIARSSARIALIENPKRIQAAAVNAAVSKYGSGSRFLIRVDAHAGYPDRYCETLLSVQARTQADSVVVTMRAAGSGCFQRAAAAAQNSLLGNGGSAHRNETADRWVEHGHHALMTIDAFKAGGGYDETFTHNEDAELDARLINHGFHIYLTGEARVTYYPRGSVFDLVQQYFNFGRGRARNFLKHPESLKIRHLVLVAVAPILCLGLLTPVAGIFALPVLAWAGLCVGYGVVLGKRLRDPCAGAAGIAAMAMQAGWSLGFLRELIANVGGAKSAERAEPEPLINELHLAQERRIGRSEPPHDPRVE